MQNRSSFAAALLVGLLAACTGGSDESSKDVPPSGLQYAANPAVYTLGAAIAPNTPSSSGSAVVSYSVFPQLPAGLSLNTSTGVVSGIPTAATAAATYIVTAANSAGSTTVGLSITVTEAVTPPTGLTYSVNPAVYTLGIAIAPNTPSSSGSAVVSYSVSPQFPPGLNLNATTGVISGTPTAATPVATYTVTAANPAGSTTVTLEIAIIDRAPQISYSPATILLTRWSPMTPLTPTNTGGPVFAWSVTPQLPSALLIDSSTGTISGAATVLSPAADYIVTAEGPGGTAYFTLRLQINPPPPMISSQPADAFVGAGQPATFSVVATGTGPLSYRWLKEGMPISGALGASYTTPPSTLSDNNSTFTVDVSDPYGGAVTSRSAVLKVADGSFTTVGSMGATRYDHSAVTLPSGQVLVAFGRDGSGNNLNTAELFTPATGTFAPTGSGVGPAREYHSATLLRNGQVIFAGGRSGGTGFSSAELYNPATGAFTATGSLSAVRYDHTATLLPDGQVLLAGGFPANAELYDPATGLFTTIAPLLSPRLNHTATLLPNGKVLIAGGGNGMGPLSQAELYNPATRTFEATGTMTTPRRYHTATLLSNGLVLITGGRNSFAALDDTELYNPASETFAPSGKMSISRSFHTATLLNTGKVLLVGGDSQLPPRPTSELYDPATEATTRTADTITARGESHAAALLNDGSVLISGGNTSSYSITNMCELYVPQ